MVNTYAILPQPEETTTCGLDSGSGSQGMHTLRHPACADFKSADTMLHMHVHRSSFVTTGSRKCEPQRKGSYPALSLSMSLTKRPNAVNVITIATMRAQARPALATGLSGAMNQQEDFLLLAVAFRSERDCPGSPAPGPCTQTYP